MSQEKQHVVDCPACGRAVPWNSENRFRPFCSARCKGVDLGAWASGQYRVASTEPLDLGEVPDQPDH